MPRVEPRGTFQPNGEEAAAIEVVQRHARDVSETGPLDELVERLANADCVLMGEASHGTSEYYRRRAELSARLIRDHGFSFVAVEGDWTSCYALNRYVKDFPEADSDPESALASFDRWPTWMWANWEIVAFLSWLRGVNDDRPMSDRAGFYGLDVYGLYESLEAVIEYLEEVDPQAAEDARDAYRCFEPYGEDAQEYARAMRMVPETCEGEVIEVLESLRDRSRIYPEKTPDDRFNVEQNALVARNAEEYYRAMVGGHEDSWNVRDEHMAETLNRLLSHHGEDAQGIVWAHNTHVGDARATDMPRHGRLNIGQLAREQLTTGDVFILGFGSDRGSVIAADHWGAELRTMTAPSARSGSHEAVFHAATPEDTLLFSDALPSGNALEDPRGHRAIGVVYNPTMESGNYVPTLLPERYDAYLHLDSTTAVHPMEMHPDRDRVPDLYPSGF